MKWTTKYSRLWVRFCRLFFWTLAARRDSARADIAFILNHCRTDHKRGLERVRITAADGSTIKNVYVHHPWPSLAMYEAIQIDLYQRFGDLPKIPRV